MDRATSGRAGFRLGRRAHKVVLTAHVLASVGWFGLAVTIAFGAVAAATTNDANLANGLARTIELIPWLSIPLGLLAVATGTWLGLGTKWGLVRYWWVVAKIAIAAAVMVTDATLVSSAARDAITTGDASSLVGSPLIPHVVVLGIATVLSIFKPRARTPLYR
jgi:uncharacterized membrane protein